MWLGLLGVVTAGCSLVVLASSFRFSRGNGFDLGCLARDVSFRFDGFATTTRTALLLLVAAVVFFFFAAATTD